MALALKYICCSLANDKDAETNYDSLRDLLLENVWSYFTCKKKEEMSQEIAGLNTDTNGKDDDDNSDKSLVEELPSLLISLGLTGCSATLDLILDVARTKISQDVPMKQIINVRLPCNFPIPDTWIHRTVPLAVSPLHMACWKLDVVMIRKLLSMGADPNQLAWEGVAIKGDHSNSSTNGEGEKEGRESYPESSFDFGNNSPVHGNESGRERIRHHGFEFNPANGLSPLHFVALGIRSPPRNSLTKGEKQGIIHDICVNYHAAITSSKRDSTEKCYSSDISSVRDLYPVRTLEEIDVKSEIVEKCIKTLLSAGANPNSGEARYLSSRYPIDVIIQPPISVYYASTMARSTQTSESLSRQNFELNLPHITMAVRTLLHEGARLSPKFLSQYSWHLHFFDCFYTRAPQGVFSFVEFLLFLGVFPIRSSENAYTDFDIKRFIAAANNNPVPDVLVGLLMKWLSLPLLHEFMQKGKEILARSSFSLPYVSQLVELATKEQLPPLKHLCKQVILGAINFDINRVQSLPLPPPLLRDLRVIRY